MTRLTCPSTRDTGFTLMELLVVITIIVLLVGLIIGAGAALRVSGKESHARTVLGGLDGIAAEYETATTKPVFHMEIGGGVFGWDQTKARNSPEAIRNGDPPAVIRGTSGLPEPERTANLLSERFVWAAYRYPATREGLDRLGDTVLVDLDEDGFLELRDPWGQSIAYAFQSRHDQISEDDFLPEQPRSLFASAGADGKWGEAKTRSELGDAAYESYLGTDEGKDSRDNLYSFDLDRTGEATLK